MNFIVETRNEYTIQLVNILSPLIYEGFESIYKDTMTLKASNPTNKILKTFQQFIKKIPSWNDNIINMETNRIISQSRCDWLLDLIKAVIKSNILLLSNNNMHSNFKVDEDYLNISLPNFIHRCYIESARQFYSMPYLFSKDFRPIDRKKNQKECISIIDSCIREAIRKNLPIHKILKQYLGNEIIGNNDTENNTNTLSEEYKSGIQKKISTFINPAVVENFKESALSSSSNDFEEDCDDKETINLIRDIKEKFNNGELIKEAEVKVDRFIHNIANNPSVSEGLLNYSYDKNKSLNEETKEEKPKVSPSSATPIRFSERERQLNGGNIEQNHLDNNLSPENNNSDIEVNNVEADINNEGEHEESLSDKLNKTLSQIEEDNDLNNSISYRIDHDSDYEAVFSNLNDNYDLTNKKKRKDEYFSKFNNI